MTLIFIGLITAFNFLIILWKYKHERHLEATIDSAIMIAIFYMFVGTISGMTVGMVASLVVSIVLLFNPIDMEGEDVEESKA